MKRLTATLLSAFILSALMGTGYAQNDGRTTIYKWTDASGTTYYGQTPPPGMSGNRIEVLESSTAFLVPKDRERYEGQQEATTPKAPSFSGFSQLNEEKESDAKKSESTEKLLEEARSVAKNRDAKRCEEATDYLNSLNDYMGGEYGKLKMANEDGSYRTLDEIEVRELHEQAMRDVEIFCE